MKWLEIIDLRTTHNGDVLDEFDLKALIAGIKGGPKPVQIITYHHGTLNTDFSLHIQYDSTEPDWYGSELGIMLVSMLKPLGMVNHNIWIAKACST